VEVGLGLDCGGTVARVASGFGCSCRFNDEVRCLNDGRSITSALKLEYEVL
jgi:hypothetical protein